MMDLEGAIAELKNKDNSETFNKAFHSLQAIADNQLAHGGHGLAALKSLLDAVASELGSNSHGLAVLKALVSAIDARLDDGDSGLAVLRALIDALGGELGDPAHGLAAMKDLVTAIQADLDDGASGLDALKASLDAVRSRVDRLAGEPPASGSVAANWNSGIATSGEAGADVVTIGASGVAKKLLSLIVSIHGFTAGGRVTIRMYTRVNGVERKVYQEDFNKGTDPDGCWIVNGPVGIHEEVRVEAESNRAADNGVAIDYDFMLEAMQ
jgi:hypothetical protein